MRRRSVVSWAISGLLIQQITWRFAWPLSRPSPSKRNRFNYLRCSVIHGAPNRPHNGDSTDKEFEAVDEDQPQQEAVNEGQPANVNEEQPEAANENQQEA